VLQQHIAGGLDPGAFLSAVLLVLMYHKACGIADMVAAG
jgi:hypothetical protein